MNQTNQIWLVEISSRKGEILATKKLLPKAKFNNVINSENGQGTLAVINIDANALLTTAFVTTKGELPIGIIPINENQADNDNESSKVLWINLGFIKNGNNNAVNEPEPLDEPAEQKSDSNRNNNSDGLMTEKQRRFLFRLLAERDINGKEAETYLKNAFQVSHLNKAGKRDASSLIEKLIQEGEAYA